MKPPRFNFQYHFSKSSGHGPHSKVPPEFRNVKIHHPAYNYSASKFIPFVLISSLYLSPSLQHRCTELLDHYVITNRGLNGRDDFYYRNNISLYGLERAPKASLIRRVGSWMVDGAIVSAVVVPMLKMWRVPNWICVTMASVTWFGRDIWLQRFGMQSPGRNLCGIHVISTNGSLHETWSTMKVNSVVAVLLGLSEFIKSSMYSNAAYLSVFSRGNKAQRRGWIALFGVIHIVIGMCTALGYGMAFGQLMVSKQTWFDRIAEVQIVNTKDLPLITEIESPYNRRRRSDIVSE